MSAPRGAVDHEAHGGLHQIEDHQAERGALGLAVAQVGGDGQTLAVGGDGREGIDPAGAKVRVGERRVDHQDRLPVGPVEIHPLEHEPAASRLGLVDEVVDVLAVRRDRRARGPDLVGERMQRAVVFDIAKQVLVFGVALAAPVGVGRAVQDEPLGIHREDLGLHVEVRAGHVRLGRELHDFEAFGGIFVDQIGPELGLGLLGRDNDLWSCEERTG